MPPNPPSFRYRLEYIGFRLIGAIATALPVEVASAVYGRLFRWLGPLARKRHPRLLDNLAQAFPDMPEPERRQLALDVWTNLGRVLGEFFHIEDIVHNRMDLSAAAIMRETAERGGGAVVCGAHQTNWEAGSAAIAVSGLNPMGVYHPLSNPFVDEAIKRRRSQFYPGGLTAKRDQATPRAMMRHVRNGSAAAFMMDQATHNGLMVPFFGRPARSTQFPALIARQLNKPLLLITAKREPGVRFIITCQEIPVPRTDDKDADILAATAAMQAVMEKAVREQPDQWMWTHSRWS